MRQLQRHNPHGAITPGVNLRGALDLPLPPPRPLVRISGLPPRRFRWDYAPPEVRVLIEIQGGTWQIGGHSSGKGIQRDCEKRSLATAHGWQQFSLTGEMINHQWLGVMPRRREPFLWSDP